MTPNSIATSLPTKIRIQGSVATDTTNLIKQDNKDSKIPAGTKLLPAQTTTTSACAPHQNGLLAKPATVAMSTASPTTVASAIPVVQKGSHFHVQPGAMAPAGSIPAPKFTHVFPSNALTKVGMMTVPTLQGSIARVPFKMTASTSAPLLMRNQAPNVSKVYVSTPSESSQETVNSQQGSEQDGPSEEMKTAEKKEVLEETKTEESKQEESNKGLEEKHAESSEMENVPNFLDDVDSLNAEKKFLKSEPQSKCELQSKSKNIDSEQENEKDENSAQQEESKCLVPLTVQNLEEDLKKKTKEKKETKPSEITKPEVTDKHKSVVEIKQEPQSEEDEKPSVDESVSKEEKKKEGENKKSEKEDFDAVGAMDWKDGVGELEGSNLKVGSHFYDILYVNRVNMLLHKKD